MANLKRKEYGREFTVFCVIWFVILMGIGIWRIAVQEYLFAGICFAGAFLLSGLYFIYPQAIRPVMKLWIKVGDIIGRINGTILMFVMFFVIFTPIAVTLKLFGKDLLGKHINKNTESYWIKRQLQPGSMKNQF